MATFNLTAQDAYPPLPTIADDIKEASDQMDFITEGKILHGFDYEFHGTMYHFNFDDKDQANFIQEMIRAFVVGNTSEEAKAAYTASWRGHLADGSAETLTMNYDEFFAFAMTLGSKKAELLSHGWAVKNEFKACKNKGELNAVKEKYNLEAEYIKVRDHEL